MFLYNHYDKGVKYMKREKVDFIKSMKNIVGMPMTKRFKILFTLLFATALALNLSGCAPKDEEDDFVEDMPQQQIEIPQDEVSSSSEVGTVEIPQDDEDTDKMVSIAVEDLGRANPFVPPNEAALVAAANIPAEKLKYDLLDPMDVPAADTVAQKVVTTKVSGIMYDKSNPSAILSIEGSDYFVRSGDVVNGYKILAIGKNHVTVQMGSNVYKAGVGQLVTEGQSEVKYNTVANLSNKFGGSKK